MAYDGSKDEHVFFFVSNVSSYFSTFLLDMCHNLGFLATCVPFQMKEVHHSDTNSCTETLSMEVDLVYAGYKGRKHVCSYQSTFFSN